VSARSGIDQCGLGNTAVGIPLFESSLRAVGLDLPPRDAAPAPTLTRASHGATPRAAEQHHDPMRFL
jgi:hypothetical protein